MSRTARLFQLMQALRSGPQPRTSIQLAQDLGVSARTVHRDIDTLRGLGAVIDGEAGFGFTLIEDATLPPLGFLDDELEALVLGLREVELIGDPALSDAASAALRKLQGRLPQRQSHHVRSLAHQRCRRQGIEGQFIPRHDPQRADRPEGVRRRERACPGRTRRHHR